MQKHEQKDNIKTHSMTAYNAEADSEMSSGALRKQQKELESLRRLAKIKGGAWWEWDAYEHRFIVSQEWERLTGYEAAEVFPMDLSPHKPIEGLLDDFIDQWLEKVHPNKKEEAKRKASKFLLTNSSDDYFEFGYPLLMKDGTYRLVLTVARSVWIEGRLINLFVRTQDIQQWASVEESAIQSAKTKEKVSRQSEKIKELSSTITVLIRSAAPLFLAAFVALNEVIGPIAKEIRKTLDLTLNPPVISKPPEMMDEDTIFFGSIDNATASQIKDLLTSYSVYGESIRLAAYTPAYLTQSSPYQYQYLLQASDDEKYEASEAPQSTGINPTIKARTSLHMKGQPYIDINGSSVSRTMPFTIKRDDGRSQDFFVEILNDSLSDNLDINSKTQRLAVDVKAMLDASSATAD